MVALNTGESIVQNPPPQPQPVCFETEIGNKCGTDSVLDWVTCGDGVCNTREVIFDFLTTVKRTSSGFQKTEVDPCTRSEIVRECVIDPDTGQAMCVYQGETETTVLNGKRASPPTCGDVEAAGSP